MEIGEITTCITALIIAMGAAFCLGMFVCTQISEWIDKKIKK
tara:strand:- start:492 stop:617 length:126 start_codon:yes stop_codon:yes gene_type:complete